MQAVKADVFEELARLKEAGEKFDIVLADPPPFGSRRSDLEPGAKAYRKLARLAAEVTAPGGTLMVASCSHNIPPERFAAECAAGLLRTGRRASLIRQAGAGPDHPVHPLLPESAYLTGSGLRPRLKSACQARPRGWWAVYRSAPGSGRCPRWRDIAGCATHSVRTVLLSPASRVR